MATDNVLNGTSLILKTGATEAAATAFAFTTSSSLSVTMNTRDISNKQSAGWRELLEAQKSWSISADGLVAYNDSASSAVKNVTDLISTLIARQAIVYVEMTTDVVGDTSWYGSAFITNVEMCSPLEDNVTFSCTLEGTGSLTPVVNS